VVGEMAICPLTLSDLIQHSRLMWI